ncbi:MAG: hypothetical protein CBD07_004895 [Flavobacteriaceae bacterium TMED147]|nr:MAG: hypothetical protein CBD07_004895 [Flavobacteriaceae bacterium TMED147]
MATGIIFRFFISFSGYDDFAFLDNLIPVLGTVGLILIVLEGAIELEINRKKMPLILKGFLAALVILIANIFALQWVFENIFRIQNTIAVLFAIPLSIISSAVAIPSAASMIDKEREFIIYESTFSDILGIMIFNYAIRQFESEQVLVGAEPLISLVLQILGVIMISLLITYVLFRLMQQIDHKVQFFLILALLILVYAFGKLLHLPALVTIFFYKFWVSSFDTFEVSISISIETDSSLLIIISSLSICFFIVPKSITNIELNITISNTRSSMGLWSKLIKETSFNCINNKMLIKPLGDI